MDRYLCIHGHYYQPPRENPWLEAVELQESADPYHDWNDRIADECYAANARSRILDADGRVTRIVNNYAWTSFNFGPTLLSWLEEKRPDVYAAVLEADRQSAARFGGHGSALAQGWGHVILPLSNPRDRRTQVLWGVRDFERRFGRKPEGMWLPECAVNTDSLEALAEQEVLFTVLAPRQAGAFRAIGAEPWTEADGGIDPSRAYLCRLPSGRTISLFFYDGPVSQAVAFEKLLESGEKFASRLMEGFDPGGGEGGGTRDWPQLMHIATDGETYGHHHRHGDMALAYALGHVESEGLARLTNYGQFLEMFPPTHEVRIVEDSSWSCVHGVERWRSNCGCSSGRPGWHQEWRGPLRAALDWLRDAVGPVFEAEGAKVLKDPWRARDAYISVIMDRSRENVDAFFAEHALDGLGAWDLVKALRLLEMQRHAMLMYTSCGWFFDELSGIETVQVTRYAARVLQLAEQVSGTDLEPEFLRRLEGAPSNVSERPDGRRIYEDFVKPSVVQLEAVGAHFAIASVFEPTPHAGGTVAVYAYDVEQLEGHEASAGRARMRSGRVRLTSRITRATADLTYGVLYLGDHMLSGGVRHSEDRDGYERLMAEARGAFDRAEYTETLRVLHDAFPETTYTLRSLFKDEQRRVLDRILDTTLTEVEAGYRQVYANHAPLLKFMGDLRLAPPPALRLAAEFVLHAAIRRSLRAEPADLDALRTALREAKDQGVVLDEAPLAYGFQKAMERMADALEKRPGDTELIGRMGELAAVARSLPFEARLWRVQNVYYELLESLVRGNGAGAAGRDGVAPAGSETVGWRESFLNLGRELNVKVD